MTFFDKIMPLRTATRRKQNGHQTAKSRRNTYYMHLSPSGKSTFYMHYHLSGYKLIPLCRISPVKCSLLAKKGAQRSPAYIEETLTHTTTSFFTNLNLSRLRRQTPQPVVTVLSWKGTQHPLRNPLQCSGEPQGEHAHSDTQSKSCPAQ